MRPTARSPRSEPNRTITHCLRNSTPSRAPLISRECAIPIRSSTMSRNIDEHPENETVLHADQDYASISREISDIVLRPAGRGWWLGFGLSGLGVLIFIAAAVYLFYAGVGIWGVNTTVVWGFAIINYVWWIGIGNAGTLISAMLYLARQPWRTSINRFAEAMTI